MQPGCSARPDLTSTCLLRTQYKLSQIPRMRDHSGEIPNWLCRRGALAQFVHPDSRVAVSNLAGTAWSHSSISCAVHLSTPDEQHLRGAGTPVLAPCAACLAGLPRSGFQPPCTRSVSRSSFASFMLHRARASQPARPAVTPTGATTVCLHQRHC